MRGWPNPRACYAIDYVGTGPGRHKNDVTGAVHPDGCVRERRIARAKRVAVVWVRGWIQDPDEG